MDKSAMHGIHELPRDALLRVLSLTDSDEERCGAAYYSCCRVELSAVRMGFVAVQASRTPTADSAVVSICDRAAAGTVSAGTQYILLVAVPCRGL